jgi:endoglucanase
MTTPAILIAKCSVLVMLLALFTSSLPAQEKIVPPLHTSGRQILDSKNQAVRLRSVNWFGFDQKEFVAGGLDHAPLAAIIEQLHALGLNSVRLPWANETLEKNPVVADSVIKSNPQFGGKRAM